MKRAQTRNPVLLLDELDKIGADFKGDPAAALLEVLDPEQNCHFHDNYIDVDFDLSHVLFIATANTLQTVSRPLLDRIEVIDIPGYLLEEKVEIAKRHLLPRILKEQGWKENSLSITDEAFAAIIERYTAESGVRQLEKSINAIVRKAVLAKMRQKDFVQPVLPEHLQELLGTPPFHRDKCEPNPVPGVVTGLAWTQVGGEILLVEVSLAPVKAGGKLTLTGNLGDVMKESASIALQWVKANANDLGIDNEMFEKYNIHVHFPEGAIPKDGPSAGITMATAIVSALTGRPVKSNLAMTGEITLRGRVLPVGGIREKILAARRAGVTDVILSNDNRRDIADIPAKYLEGLTMHHVDTVAEVIEQALTK
jgi:ATP-dependent Lon protease